jgi:hypothetical protein
MPGVGERRNAPSLSALQCFLRHPSEASIYARLKSGSQLQWVPLPVNILLARSSHSAPVEQLGGRER